MEGGAVAVRGTAVAGTGVAVGTAVATGVAVGTGVGAGVAVGTGVASAQAATTSNSTRNNTNRLALRGKIIIAESTPVFTI